MTKLDILNREEFVDKLVRLTENISANKRSTSFAINGVWGCGKSFVLDMYEERLAEIQSEEAATEKYFVARYNCWKYDYYEEPLIAIVSSIIETVEEKTELFPDGEKKSKILGALKAVGISLLSMANSAIRQKTGVDLEKAYKVVKSGIDNGAKTYEQKHEYDVYFGFNKAMRTLQETLKELSNDYTVILIVDELDRCLPEYAIKVLERLHHLTEDAQNTITVLSIDKAQLDKSLANLFGLESCDTYFKKFIEFEVELDYGCISKRIIEKHSKYISLFDNTKIEYEDSIEEFMQAVFQEIEIREQEQIISRVTLAHQLLFEEPEDYSFMCLEVLCTILYTRYHGVIKFSDWFDSYYRIVESGKESPPFNAFFTTKFNAMRCEEVIRINGTNSGSFRVLDNDKSLYAAIAYLWYALHPSYRSSEQLEFKNVEIMNLLNKNTEGLKKFVEVIKLIK